MYNVGVFAGKFTPPHRGHLNAIINASTKCNKLYVVMSDNPVLTEQLCKENNLPIMDMKLRTKWLSQELQGFDHIKVIMLDETGIPVYPYGWEQWAEKLKSVVTEEFDVIFGGEISYTENHIKYFPNVAYEIYDSNRLKFPISATEIRKYPLKHWDYILDSAKPFFAKKVLIAGTESCGKTTLTKYLGKIYNTSWSEEEGRYYSTRYLGGNEEVFTIDDFGIIAHEQYKADMDALRKANKVVFYDSDAVITEYYAELYLGEQSKVVEGFINPDRYDLVLLFTPDVKWVDDGFRWNKEDKIRNNLHSKLKQMYIDYGFGDKLVEINGDYSQRLEKAINIIDDLIKNNNEEK